MAAAKRQRIRLTSATVAVSKTDGRETVVHVPAGTEVILVGDLDESDLPNRMVEVVWNGELVSMFAVDIIERGAGL